MLRRRHTTVTFGEAVVVDQATFGGGVGGVSRRLERTTEGHRQACSNTGVDHSKGRTRTMAIEIDGQHRQPQPPIPPQHDFIGERLTGFEPADCWKRFPNLHPATRETLTRQYEGQCLCDECLKFYAG